MSLWRPFQTIVKKRCKDILCAVFCQLRKEQAHITLLLRNSRMAPDLCRRVGWICLAVLFPPFMWLQGMYIKSTYDGLHVITGTTEGVSFNCWSWRYNKAAAICWWLCLFKHHPVSGWPLQENPRWRRSHSGQPSDRGKTFCCTFFLITATSQHWFIHTLDRDSCFCFIFSALCNQE